MKCKFCREEIPDGVKFCPMCGTVVAEEGKPDSQMPGAGETDQTQPAQVGQQSGDGNSYGYKYGTAGQSVCQSPQQPINGTLYLVLSVLSLLMCCLPLGIVSLIFSSKINSQQRNGDYDGARDSAGKAKLFLIISLVLGLIANVVIFGFAFAGVSNGVTDISEMKVEDELMAGNEGGFPGEDGLDGDLDGIMDKEIKAAPQASELGSGWDSYTVRVNDRVIAFPCEYKEFEMLGFAVDEEIGLDSEDGMVSGGGYAIGYLTDKEGNSIMVDFINPDGGKKKANECLIGGISVNDYDLENGKLSVVFPGNVQIGADREEVVKKYGETEEEVYEGEEVVMYSWRDADTCYSSVDASFDAGSGKLTQITMRNYGE